MGNVDAADTIVMSLPPHLDLADVKAREVLAASITNLHKPQFTLSHIDVTAHTAVYRRHTLASAMASHDTGITVTLASTIPMNAPLKLEDQYQRILEANPDTYPHPPNARWYLAGLNEQTRQLFFAAYTDREHHIREAIASDVLRCPPWSIRVAENPDKTIDVLLPLDYSPMKHEKLLAECVSTKIGQFGWYASVDVSKPVDGTNRYQCRIIPADPPAFAPTYPIPAATPTPGTPAEQMLIPIGWKLGKPGTPNRLLAIDFHVSPHLMASGQTGGGKSVGANCLMVQLLERGWELMVTTIPNSASGFAWVKPYCRPAGYGCASKLATLAMLKILLQEVEHRGHLLNDTGASQWEDWDADQRASHPLIGLLVDEAPGLLTPIMSKTDAKSLPDGEEKDAVLEEIAVCALMKNALSRLVAEARKTGVRVFVFGQAMNSTTGGVTPAMRQNLGHRLLYGTNPDQGVAPYVFRNPRTVPPVPAYMRPSDPDDAVRRGLAGVGLAELDGEEPCVFKGLYYGESTDVLVARLTAAGLHPRSDTEPSADLIDYYRPFKSDTDQEGLTDADWNQSRSPISGRPLSQIAAAMGDTWDADPDTGQKVTGFTKANLARHLAATPSATALAPSER